MPTGTTAVFGEAVATETLCGDEKVDLTMETRPDDTVVEATAEGATGTTKLMPVVVSAAEGETERTAFALVSMDESSDAALERADVTITPGAVSVMVMAIV